MKMKNKGVFITALVVTIVMFSVSIGVTLSKRNVTVASFEECVAHDFPVMESYPERCMAPNGEVLTQQIVGKPVMVRGELTCLPHKATDGPVTLECAYGLKAGADHYALSDPGAKYLAQLQMGKVVKVAGELDTTDADTSKYDIIGTITVDQLTTE